MNRGIANFDSPEMSPSGGTDQLGHCESPESASPTGSHLGRVVRRFFRAIGILMMLAMLAFLTNQHLVHLIIPMGESSAVAGEPSSADDDTKKLVVCFGYADLDGGVIALNPSQSGRVDRVLVRENETVPTGAPLLQLEDRMARLRVEETKGLLDEASARLAKAEKAPEEHRLQIAEQQAAVKTARYRLAAARHTLVSRQEQLRGESIGRLRDDPTTAEGVASTAQRIREFEEVVVQQEDKLRALELQDPRIDLEQVRAEAEATHARWLQAKQVLDEHTLKAPEAGRVLRIFITSGEFLTVPPRRMAMQFCPDRPRIIRAEVEQSFAGRIELGQPALVEDDGSAKSTWRGHVMRISDWYTERRQLVEENPQSKDVRTLECLVSLDPGQPPLRIGQRVRVTISRRDP
jgi:multidrug resistance efflux pump